MNEEVLQNYYSPNPFPSLLLKFMKNFHAGVGYLGNIRPVLQPAREEQLHGQNK